MDGSTPSWEAQQGVIGGEVILPGSPAFEELPKPFNARFHDVRPQAIVRCATPQDVAETISFARRHSLACATRSGGHCFAGRSTSRGLVIDGLSSAVGQTGPFASTANQELDAQSPKA